ncbi:hypothetical protein CYMTET_14103 [Cymbomonas tetramitiformis]|uniref:Uncharacterized protein n=1 Tax=Cymbomonas tetramitiformis TaxID=36881 RepID=A0AAE0LAQ0_9CHLO|nr:hypothetical protein CYMTET_14103 [Cymbomonas tetramitiformis]
MRGAVTYGLDTDRIKARIMRRTYGVKTQIQFNARLHDELHRVWCKKRERFQCRDAFLQYVSAGEEISAEAVVKKTLKKSHPTQSMVNLHILSSEDGNPIYADDPNVREEAIIQIPVDDAMDNQYECEFLFGSTTLEVAATEVETGITKVVEVDFERSQEVGGG